jgi:hypothetical protein
MENEMITKECSKCKSVKDILLFNKKKNSNDGFQPYCRECSRLKNRTYYKNNKSKQIKQIGERRKERRVRNRRFVFDYLMINHCIDCGETDPRVLEFDHRSDKLANIADLLREVCSIEKLKEEIAKCDVRCANCHRRKTAIEQDWYTHKYLQN